MSKRAQDTDCELFHSSQNKHMAHGRLQKRLRKNLGAKVADAMVIAMKATMTPELLTEDEKAFHQKVMTSNKSEHFDKVLERKSAP